MLEETADEFVCFQGHGLGLVGERVQIAEGDEALGDVEDSTVGDSYPMDVASEVREDGLSALNGGLAEDVPFLPPDSGWDHDVRESIMETVSEDGSEDDRESSDRNQIGLAGRDPFLVVGDAACWNEAMNMGMVTQCPRPGMQNGKDSELAADITRILGQLEQRFGGRLHEDAVDFGLVRTYGFVKLVR